MKKSRDNEPPKRRDDEVYAHDTYYLVDWYFGAARHSLRLAGSDDDMSSAAVVHRVSAVFFAAAAVEAWLGQMADEMFDGMRGGVNDRFEVLKPLRETLRNADWSKKLSIYSWLWSTQNRWNLAREQPCVKVVENLMQLRNALIHPRPHTRVREGNKRTARFSLHYRELIQFGTTQTDLPADFIRQLAISSIGSYINAAEELVARLRSLGVLHEDPGAVDEGLPSHAVLELNETGSRTWTNRSEKRAQQVRWCSKTSRYVMHTFELTDAEVLRRANGERIEPEERRRCTNSATCRKVNDCPWSTIREPSSFNAHTVED